MKKIVPALFWLTVFLAFLTPMELGDVWWHLKSGEWILQSRGLPAQDPFSYTTGSPAGTSFVLRGFWLCQALLYVLSRAVGLYGVVVFKAAAFALTFFILHRLVARKGLMAPLSYAVLLPVVFIAHYYDEARPQTVSFLFFALSLYLLERSRAALSSPEKDLPAAAPPPHLRPYLLLPPLMLLWSNMHPGFSIGFAFIALYMLESLATTALRRPRSLQAGFVLASAAALSVSALNPNYLEAVVRTKGMLLSSLLGGNVPIHEHLPMKEFSSYTRETLLYPVTVAFIALGAASFLLRRRKIDVLHLLVFAGLSLAALKTFRAGLFLAIAGTPVIGRNLSGLEPPRWLRESRPVQAGSAAFIVLVAAFLLWPGTFFSQPLVNGRITPVKAASFIEENTLPGNIYHPYEWGGYLMWRLYPEYRVFIDGRAIGPMKEHREVLFARQEWKIILSKYGINTVLYWPLLPYRGNVPPLLFALLKDNGWSPVYWDTQSVVFVRAGMAEQPVKKRAVWELLTSLVSANIMKDPSEASNYTALGEVYLGRGLPSEAKRMFEKALSLDPSDNKAAFWLGTLR